MSKDGSNANIIGSCTWFDVHSLDRSCHGLFRKMIWKVIVCVLSGLCALTSVADIEQWTRSRNQSRPAFPHSYVQSEQPTVYTRNNVKSFEKETTIVNGHVPIAGQSLSWSLIVDEQDESVAEAACSPTDGISWTIGVYTQLGNSVPYYWTGKGYDAFVGADIFSAAEERVRNIFCSMENDFKLFIATNVLVKSEVEISMLGGETVELPFERCIFLFIDDQPNANWAHPCRYVFFNETLTDFVVSYQMYSPRVCNRVTGRRIRMKCTGVVENVVSLKAVTDIVYNQAREMIDNSLSYDGDVSKSYFVLVSGGADPENNGIRFWADTAMMYATLTKKYGVPKSHIKVYISDGTSTSKDANLAGPDDPVLVSSPTDLDGDGVSDVTGAATKSDVQSAFSSLKSQLTSNDQLFVFITSHGGADGTAGINNRNCKAYLYSATGSAYFRDDELSDWTSGFSCPVAFAIETCYAGGFVDDLTAASKRVVATACNHYESSIGISGGGKWGTAGAGQTCAYNCWAIQFIAAMRGFYPAIYDSQYYVYAYPWVDDLVCNADTSGDNFVSMKEASTYATSHDECAIDGSEHPQYGESSSGFGSTFFLIKKSTASAPANDNFANATTISGQSGSTTGSNVGATSQSGEPLLTEYSTAKTTVWWKWTAPASGSARIDTVGSSFDTQMGIYRGSSLSSLSRVTTDDDSGSSNTSICTFDCTSGTTYYICVGGWSGRSGTIKLNWSLTPTTVSKPDLAIRSYDSSWPAAIFLSKAGETSACTSFEEGSSVAFSFAVGNIGSAATTRTFGTRISILNSNGTTQFSYVYTNQSSSVSAGATAFSYTHAVWTSFSRLSAGSYVFKVSADCYDNISESNENNNEASVSFTVTAAFRPLTPTISLSASATTGTSSSFDLSTVTWKFDKSLIPSWVTSVAVVSGNNNRISFSPGSGTSTLTFSGPAYFIVNTTANTGSARSWAWAIKDNSNNVACTLTVTQAAGSSTSAPANDNFANATSISGQSGSTTGSNVGATSQSGEPLLASYSSATNTVWWKWTAPASGSARIDTVGSSFDTQMGIYRGSSLSSLSRVTTDDDSGSSNTSICTFDCTSGTTYYICIGGYSGRTGTIKLQWNLTILAPANDNFANATSISGQSGSTTGSNVGATSQSGEPLLASYSSATNTVWWKWTAPASGSARIDTVGSPFDTQMGIYTGSSLSSLSRVTTDDDSGSSNTSICTFDCISGTTYYICVGGWSGRTGTIKLNWSLTPTLNPPSTPSILVSTYGTNTANTSYIRISWSGGDGASSFNLYRSTTSTRPSSPFATNVTSYYDDYKSTSGLTPGVKYWYWVAAVNSSGTRYSDSDWGNILVSLSLGKSTDSYVADGGSGSASVTANTAWSATASVSWISFTAASGSGNGALRYTVAANTSASSRTGTITVTAGSGTSFPATKIITVTQDGAIVDDALPDLGFAVFGDFAEDSFALFTVEQGSSSTNKPVRLFNKGDGFSVAYGWANFGEGVCQGEVDNLIEIVNSAGTVVHSDVSTKETDLEQYYGIETVFTAYAWTNLTADAYYVRVMLDSTDKVEEEDEDDNEATFRFAVRDPVSLGAALDNTTLTFVTDGSNGWFGTKGLGYDGIDAAQSMHIGHSSTNRLSATVIGAGTLSFKWKVSSESGYDYLRLVIDGVEKASISGTTEDWRDCSCNLASGSHIIEWLYTKDGSGSAGGDCGWVDQVVWTTSQSSPTAPTGVNATDGIYTNKVRVSWTASSGATSYNLYRSTTSSRSSTAFKTGITSPYDDTTATPGVMYYYWVSAVNSAGSTISSYNTGHCAVSLSLDKSATAFVASGGSTNVSVVANTSWSATNSVSWIALTASVGNGNGTLKYSVSANTSTSSRTGTITVKAGSGTSYPVTKTVTVTQEGVPETIATPVITPPNGATFESESCTVTITCATSGATIYYTSNGRTPRIAEANRYIGPFTIRDTATIVAIAVKGDKQSEYAEATITKVIPVPLTLAGVLDESKLGRVITGGDAEWLPIKDNTAKVDGSCAVSGTLDESDMEFRESWLEAKVYGKGTLSFWWRVSCEPDPRGRFSYDYAMFEADDAVVARKDGETGWVQVTKTFATAGEHTIRWSYNTDGWPCDDYDGCVWVDGVTWSGSAASVGAIVPAEITGGKAIEVESTWAAKYPTFAAKFGDDLATALTKKTGKKDANGAEMAVWQDYVAGTDPTDPKSQFKASVEFVGGKPVVKWTPDLNENGAKSLRVYKTFGAKSLGGLWEEVSGNEADYNFFKVTVEMP